jgi:small-conductance mechanosensitive channel
VIAALPRRGRIVDDRTGFALGRTTQPPAWNDPRVPSLTDPLNSLIGFLSTHAVSLVLISVALLFLVRGAKPLIHRLLIGAFRAQQVAIGDQPVHRAEMERRVATIEDLLSKAIRALVLGAIVALILGLFDLWSLVAGLGIVIAAVTLAGQSIILDFLMGILILAEGQYFKGDIVLINGIEGTVEEVTLRRTLIRDVRGTLHMFSNGLVRSPANLTRTFAAASIEIDGVSDGDVEAVIAVLGEVGRQLAADEELGPLLLDTPGYTGTTRLTSAGATVRMSGKVRPEARARVEQEMRRRVAGALAERGLKLIRPGGYRAQ